MERFNHFNVVTALALFVSACAHAPAGTPSSSSSSSAAAKPCRPAIGGVAGHQLMHGEAMGPAGPDTKRAAEMRALTEGLRTLGVTVESELIDVQTQAGGDATVSIRSRGVERLEAVEVRHMRAASCYDAAAGLARATVAVPNREWVRIGREQRGGMVLVVDCVAKPADACDATTLDGLRAAASDLGFELRSTVSPREGASPHDASALRAIGDEHDVPRVLWVRLRPSYGMTKGRTMFAWTEISAALAETGDGVIMASIEPQRFKGALPKMARYKKLDAIRESVRVAIDALNEAFRDLGIGRSY